MIINLIIFYTKSHLTNIQILWNNTKINSVKCMIKLLNYMGSRQLTYNIGNLMVNH